MYEYLRGKLVSKQPDYVVIDVNGIGYKVFVSFNNHESYGTEGSEIRLYTYLHVREDVLSLYGFQTKEKLEFFELLIQVSGIGPKVAQGFFSAFDINTLQKAIINEDVGLLTKVSGIGKKTAQRIIIELKDKIAKLLTVDREIAQENANNLLDKGNYFQDALSALEGLGYNRTEITKVLNSLTKDKDHDIDVEHLIKDALKMLARF